MTTTQQSCTASNAVAVQRGLGKRLNPLKRHLTIETDRSSEIRYQIPSISLTEEISGTVYTVTGSFEGSQNMLRKLE